MKRVRILLAGILFLTAATTLVYAQAGDGFEINWYSIDGGGGTSSGGNFSLGAAVGQPDAGNMSGGAYELTGGFWQCITDAVIDPGIASDGQDVSLAWTASTSTASIYRADNDPYFTPGSAYATGATSTWTDSGVAGNPSTNYTYLIRADGDCGESSNSKRMGEFDFSLVPGTNSFSRATE